MIGRMRPPAIALPDRPPFLLRGRLITPLPDGSVRSLDDALVGVDAAGRIASVRQAVDARGEERAAAIDVRPWVVLPGLVDLHAHLPQVPNAGLGYALPLLDWL